MSFLSFPRTPLPYFPRVNQVLMRRHSGSLHELIPHARFPECERAFVTIEGNCTGRDEKSGEANTGKHTPTVALDCGLGRALLSP